MEQLAIGRDVSAARTAGRSRQTVGPFWPYNCLFQPDEEFCIAGRPRRLTTHGTWRYVTIFLHSCFYCHDIQTVDFVTSILLCVERKQTIKAGLFS